MNLLERIKDQQRADFMEEAEIVHAEVSARAQEDQALAQIIFKNIQKVSEALGVQCEEIMPGKLYLLGDIVIHVQLYTQAEKPSPSSEKLAVMRYAVNLIGVDIRTGRLDKHRVGSLSFLDYQKLYEAVTKKDTLDFEAKEILKKSDELEALI